MSGPGQRWLAEFSKSDKPTAKAPARLPQIPRLFSPSLAVSILKGAALPTPSRLFVVVVVNDVVVTPPFVDLSSSSSCCLHDHWKFSTKTEFVVSCCCVLFVCLFVCLFVVF